MARNGIVARARNSISLRGGRLYLVRIKSLGRKKMRNGAKGAHEILLDPSPSGRVEAKSTRPKRQADQDS
jgi:hypothetical protein